MPEQQEGWVPAFDGQRPPFTPGHQLSVGNAGPLTHGAYSERHLAPVERELVAELLGDPEVPKYVKATPYRHTVHAWARNEAQILLLRKWLDAQASAAGVDVLLPERRHEGVTQVESAQRLLEKAETRAMSLRKELGLTPTSAARLGKDLAVGRAADADVARVMAELHRLEQAGELPASLQAVPLPVGQPVRDGGDDDE